MIPRPPVITYEQRRLSGARHWLVGVALCFAGCLVGCRVPSLSHARPGPVMPETFHRAADWNQRNGDWIRGRESDSSTEAKNTNDASSEEKKESGRDKNAPTVHTRDEADDAKDRDESPSLNRADDLDSMDEFQNPEDFDILRTDEGDLGPTQSEGEARANGSRRIRLLTQRPGRRNPRDQSNSGRNDDRTAGPSKLGVVIPESQEASRMIGRANFEEVRQPGAGPVSRSGTGQVAKLPKADVDITAKGDRQIAADDAELNDLPSPASDSLDTQSKGAMSKDVTSRTSSSELRDQDANLPEPPRELNELSVLAGPSSATVESWQEFFNDVTLANLIQQSFQGNQELMILAQEVRVACLEVQSRSGEYRPFVTLGGDFGADKASRYTRGGAVEEALDVAPGRNFPEPLPNFLMAANLSWEVDIWHKLRNAQGAARYRWLATRDGRNYIVTRLVAEVANSYIELLALDNRGKALNLTIEIQEKSLAVAKLLKKAGRGTELAVKRFEAEVFKNQSEMQIVEQEIIEQENHINFLLGRYPQPIERSPETFIDWQINAVQVGLPAELLRNRPDIRQAERELRAAGLDVEVARARFYPSFNISAGIGYEAFDPEYLFRTPEALIYNLVGDLVGPLINKRAIRAAYCTANARQIQAVYDYQRTVLNAYTEVVNHLTRVENYGTSITSRRKQLLSLEAAVDAANKLFKNARAEYVDVLLAQREMMESRLDLIDMKRRQLGAIVDTYQALGGGQLSRPTAMPKAASD